MPCLRSAIQIELSPPVTQEEVPDTECLEFEGDRLCRDGDGGPPFGAVEKTRQRLE